MDSVAAATLLVNGGLIPSPRHHTSLSTYNGRFSCTSHFSSSPATLRRSSSRSYTSKKSHKTRIFLPRVVASLVLILFHFNWGYSSFFRSLNPYLCFCDLCRKWKKLISWLSLMVFIVDLYVLVFKEHQFSDKGWILVRISHFLAGWGDNFEVWEERV